MAQHHDDDVVGKAYDARLMRRLLGYLRPYRLNAALALTAIIANSMLNGETIRLDGAIRMGPR